LFELAWGSGGEKGLVLVINDLPDDVLREMIVWRNEKVEQENYEYEQAKTR